MPLSRFESIKTFRVEHGYHAAMREITGLVLAGGGARRMGGADKPLADVHGAPLIRGVLQQIEPQVDAVVISCQTSSAGHYERFGKRLVHDRVLDGGPLAGIEAGLEAITTDWCFVCPGDAAAFPPDIVERLWAMTGDNRAVFVEGQFLFMLVRSACAKGLRDYLDKGGRRVQDWLGEVNAQRLPSRPADVFVNINTPAQLQAWREGNR